MSSDLLITFDDVRRFAGWATWESNWSPPVPSTRVRVTFDDRQHDSHEQEYRAPSGLEKAWSPYFLYCEGDYGAMPCAFRLRLHGPEGQELVVLRICKPMPPTFSLLYNSDGAISRPDLRIAFREAGPLGLECAVRGEPATLGETLSYLQEQLPAGILKLIREAPPGYPPS